MTREEKLDKAIGCIEYFISAYAWTSDEAESLGYALELLKEPTIQPDAPRVMTLEEIKSIGAEDVCGFVEAKDEEHMYGCYMRQYDEAHTELMSDVPNLPKKLQNGYVRIWTARPTDEQRKAVKWDG